MLAIHKKSQNVFGNTDTMTYPMVVMPITVMTMVTHWTTFFCFDSRRGFILVIFPITIFIFLRMFISGTRVSLS